MPDPTLLQHLTALRGAIEALPLPDGPTDEQFETLETVKHGLDDARLNLWARLQGLHTTDLQAFTHRFRAQRAVEICSRLTTDIRLGLLSPDDPAFTTLLGTLLELARAIHAGQQATADS